jgi:hypothetical protein
VPAPDRLDEPPLTREQTLTIVRNATADERAIQSLEERQLGFPLDRAALEWFAENGAGQDVVDYLRVRARYEPVYPALWWGWEWPGVVEDASPLLDALRDVSRDDVKEKPIKAQPVEPGQ